MEFDNRELLEECKRRCTCDVSYSKCPSQEENDEQSTFLSFLTEIISLIAFIIFGSIVFWLAVGGILLDFLKRLYLSDRYVKIFFAVLFTILFMSMSVRIYMSKRTCRYNMMMEHKQCALKKNLRALPPPGECGKSSSKKAGTHPPPPPPPPEYVNIVVKDATLRNIAEGKTEKLITRKFTMSIHNEKKKEIFKTTKVFLVPESAVGDEKMPSIVVHFNDITLDSY